MSEMKPTQKVYQYVMEYIKQYGQSPQRQEIAKAIGLSPSSINYHLKRLRSDGFIDYTAKDRSIVILDSAGQVDSLFHPIQRPTPEWNYHIPLAQVVEWFVKAKIADRDIVEAMLSGAIEAGCDWGLRDGERYFVTNEIAAEQYIRQNAVDYAQPLDGVFVYKI